MTVFWSKMLAKLELLVDFGQCCDLLCDLGLKGTLMLRADASYVFSS